MRYVFLALAIMGLTACSSGSDSSMSSSMSSSSMSTSMMSSSMSTSA